MDKKTENLLYNLSKTLYEGLDWRSVVEAPSNFIQDIYHQHKNDLPKLYSKYEKYATSDPIFKAQQKQIQASKIDPAVQKQAFSDAMTKAADAKSDFLANKKMVELQNQMAGEGGSDPRETRVAGANGDVGEEEWKNHIAKQQAMSAPEGTGGQASERGQQQAFYQQGLKAGGAGTNGGSSEKEYNDAMAKQKSAAESQQDPSLLQRGINWVGENPGYAALGVGVPLALAGSYLAYKKLKNKNAKR